MARGPVRAATSHDKTEAALIDPLLQPRGVRRDLWARLEPSTDSDGVTESGPPCLLESPCTAVDELIRRTARASVLSVVTDRRKLALGHRMTSPP